MLYPTHATFTAPRCLPADVDIIFLQNPFDHLHRDSDVEGMSDGWDPGTACELHDVHAVVHALRRKVC